MLWMFTLVVVVVVADVDIGMDEMKTYSKRQTMGPIQCSGTSKYSYNLNAYNGPYNWPKLSRCCGGRWQSPVNIMRTRARCGQPFRVNYSFYPAGRIQGKLYNDGHSAKVEFEPQMQVTLSGVPYSFQSDYILNSLHYHAGNIRGSGSEHVIDGRGYEGELHLVHYKRQYGSMEEASLRPDGLAVIGIFLQQSRFSPNSELNRYINGIASLKGSTKIPVTVDPRKLVPSPAHFYTYQGSLTTPPCSESVRWMVMRTPIPTTLANINVLKTLPTNEGVATFVHTNVRPKLPLGTRTLETNYPCFG